MRKLETFDWWSDLLALKDTLSLRELSDRFGVTPGAISASLRRTNTGRKPSAPGPRTGRDEELELDLGFDDAGDEAVEVEEDLDPEIVTPAPARPVAAPAPRRSEGDLAWKVWFLGGAEVARVVVAPDIAAAAAAAEGHELGRPVRITLLGALL